MYIPKNTEQREYYATSSRDAVREHLAMVSRRLREMADKIDRDAAEDRWGTAIHELMWGLANLSIEGLASRGAQAAHFAAIQAALDSDEGAEARAALPG